MSIKVNKIVPQTIEHFDPNGNSLGFLNEHENLDLRIQISENNIEGYSLKFNDKIVYINAKGQINNWPSGLYDITMEQFAKLFKIRENNV